MKRFRVYCLLLAAVFFLCPALTRGEEKTGAVLSEKEWTWEENSIASFQGALSMEGLPTGELLLKLSLATDPKGSNPGEIVFQTVNGKKLTLRKQKAEYTVNHEDSDILEFVGNWRTPDDVFFTKVDIILQVCAEDGGTVLAEHKLTVSRDAAELLEKDDGKIRLKTDFSAWTLWIGIGAAVIWILAVIRILLNHTKKKKGR